ncbi:hypothetical protein BDF20DRAFT_850951 [Mycotypha africana]|uniref:uncharacterized protein n=1 Tax=Mycotypha africana TaxID=64632 RepID=UPI002301DBD3|nr:uncharacterized protein BDF20DRAFT_850951 [Mycotypha africana]KAI8987572.1 hypothetical protein BDF20DRAFT_850951 [Mycotypha africana]
METFSVEINTAAVPGEGPVHRSILSPHQLVATPADGVNTLCDVLNYAATHYPDRHGFGYRSLENTITKEKKVTKIVNGVEKVEKKKWTYFQLSDYKYCTYKEAKETVQWIGLGLIKLGMRKGDKVQLSASTSLEWMFLAHGAFSQALTIVTAYDTLGPEGLQHALRESEANVCFINGEQLSMLHHIASDCPSITSIIYRGEAKPADRDALRGNPHIKHVLSYDELVQLGKENAEDDDNKPSRNEPLSTDLCCIMYTSGSTGNPKGVMLTHGNIVAAIAGVCRLLQHHLQANDTMMAYLPLAHVLEFLVENLCIFLGVTLGYGSIRTLTDASVIHCKGDLQAFAPSIMTGVPQVWETIKKTVLAKVAERGSRVERVFHGAVWMKKTLAGYGLPAGLLDTVVFNNVKKQLGGRLRYCLSGGAPVSAATQEFLSVTVCPILQGYGMTESCGMCAIMAPEQYALNEVGAPVPCVQVKLVDHPELGYTSAHSPRPQGEIWMRGPSITAGYYKQDELTKEALTEDGWLKTGDIGEWTERGTLTIIDRVKNLVKLSNGEYIALEKLESVYKSSVLVENLCVYADPLYAKPVALLVPSEKSLLPFLQQHGRKEEDLTKMGWEQLCAHPETRSIILHTMQEHAKQAGLKGAEIIADVWICKDLWTTEMGLLTAAQKLKRKEIVKMYDNELKTMLAAQK